ncbi:MAG: nuclear transport factor 2 family protein [Lachnospiraceae bacterium]|nr:nuclear transport factor 2 family protein [Lachnospiraceae bacterium]
MCKKNMEELLKVIDRFYSGDRTCVYEKARCLSGDGKEIQVSPIEGSERAGRTFARVDCISDRLAYVLVEGRTVEGYRSEVLGLIKSAGKWQIMAMLKADTPYWFHNLYRSFDESQKDIDLIYGLLMRYCHDVYLMDAPDCLGLFWDDCRMYHPNQDDSFTDVEIQVLHERWRNMPDPQELGIKEFSRIYHVELLDENTAVAKLGCAKLNNYFFDYHFLIKVNGEWKMANKMTQGLHTGDLV